MAYKLLSISESINLFIYLSNNQSFNQSIRINQSNNLFINQSICLYLPNDLHGDDKYGLCPAAPPPPPDQVGEENTPCHDQQESDASGKTDVGVCD